MSYAPPKVTGINPAAGFSSKGGDVVTVHGHGFGPPNVLGVARRIFIGGSKCQTAVVHLSDRAVRCDSTPPGSGSLRDVAVKVGNRTSPTVAIFSYERPLIT